MKVLVVGGSGFIGREIVAQLRERGVDVVVGQRRPPQAPAGGAMPVEARDAASFLRAAEGATHAINCIMGSPTDMIAATRNLMAAAEARGLRRVVHLSSVAVYGEQTGTVRETSELLAQDWYGRAKVTCETIVAASAKVETVTLRPALVGGRDSALWSTRIARLLAARRLGDLGERGDGWCNLIHVSEVARAAISALDAEIAKGRAFNLSASNPPTWNAYLMGLARGIGATPVERIGSRQLDVEVKALAPVWRGLEIVARRLGLPDPPPPITPGLAKLFSLRARYESESGAALMGEKRVSLATFVEEASAAYFSNGKRALLSTKNVAGTR